MTPTRDIHQMADPLFAWGFPTELGWMAVQTDGRQVTALGFGHRSLSSAMASLPGNGSHVVEQPSKSFLRWQRLLEKLAQGREVNVCEVPVATNECPGFASRVQAACREIPWGQTMTYGELAALAGSPRAARAVGNVMRTNRIPLLIPCHRVLGTGNLGGYSAPGGLDLKRKLLLLESGTADGPIPDAKTPGKGEPSKKRLVAKA